MKKRQVNTYLEKIGSPEYGEVSKRVRELQKTLALLGYFDHEDTAIYGDITREALIAYQRDRLLIADTGDENAGIIDEATRRALAFDLLILVTAEK